MIKVIKGNQIIIIVIAVMLVTVGYLNYNIDDMNSNDIIATSSDITNQEEHMGDAKLVNSEVAVDNEFSYTEALVDNIEEPVNKTEEKTENVITNTQEKNETVVTNAQENKEKSEDYFTNSKLERDAMYSQMIETYKNMLESSSVTAEQKAIATQEISNITNTKNSIMIAENLIQTKGFKNVVVFVNNESVNVVVGADELTAEQVAQLQNIISRELTAEVANIHISNK